MIQGVIVRPIKPTSVEVFYEDGVPYIKYIGRTELDNGLVVEVEIPKMDLVLNEVKVKSEDYYNKSTRITVSQNIYTKSEHWCKFKPLARTCTKKELEKELGYKLNITE